MRGRHFKSAPERTLSLYIGRNESASIASISIVHRRYVKLASMYKIEKAAHYDALILAFGLGHYFILINDAAP